MDDVTELPTTRLRTRRTPVCGRGRRAPRGESLERRVEVELLGLAPRLSHGGGRVLGTGLSAGSVLAELGDPVRMDDGRIGARGDHDEVAVPRGEVLERREELLLLRAELHALDALLGLPGGQVEPVDELELLRARGLTARARGRRDDGAPPRPRRTRRRGTSRARRAAAPLRCSRASGSRSRAARSSRPAATRASSGASSAGRSGACSTTQRSTAARESRRNGTSWQRERIVSGNGPSSSATRTSVAYSGGSSRSLSSAAAASSFSSCASSSR